MVYNNRPEISKLKLTVQWGNFPTYYYGLGKLDEGYSIKSRSDATPYFLSTPRHVAIPLMQKMKAKLITYLGLQLKKQEIGVWEW